MACIAQESLSGNGDIRSYTAHFRDKRFPGEFFVYLTGALSLVPNQ